MERGVEVGITTNAAVFVAGVNEEDLQSPKLEFGLATYIQYIYMSAVNLIKRAKQN